MDRPRALVERILRVKNPQLTFLCPLCRTQRAFVYSYSLTPKHYLQIILISAVLTLLFYPVMKAKALCFVFIVWGLFEAVRKFCHRREMPCPHCGFDATWYKRDVKVAKKLVQDFWSKQQPLSPVSLGDASKKSIDSSKKMEQTA